MSLQVSRRRRRPSPARPSPTHLRTPCRRYRPETPATQLSTGPLFSAFPDPLPGDALDHRETSVSVVSRSLRGDQARKRSGPSGSASGRTTKATGRFAFPEERNLRAERPILGAMARRARTEGWVQRHLAVGGTQGWPVAEDPFPSLWTLLLARIQNVSNLDDADDEI
uniref:Uncharacterized protein n=1 Tax=Mus musculus TaxID=10090 RepID=Q9D3Y4_MOUSE|nr:unnamed protein product [Mus musculus]